MKNYVLSLLMVLVFTTICEAQVPSLSCTATTTKNLTLKKLSDDSSLKLNPKEQLQFISWRSGIDNEDPFYGISVTPEYIVEYKGIQYYMDMKDIKKMDFEKPTSTNELWEILSLENDVIENLAKNGIQYSLRGELDGESIDFLSILSQSNLIYNDEYIEDYIQNLIFKIHPGRLNDKRSGVINLLIYNESNPNAFCLPNGTIGISTGLLSIIDSEDELIGILAHEIAHFVEDHHVNNILEITKRAKRAEFWAGVSTALAGAAEIYMAANNEYYTPGALTYSTAVISYQIALSMVDRFGINYSHEQEFQADEAAYDIMILLNKEPDAFVSALSKISNYLYRTGNHESLQSSHTHPALDSRLANLGSNSKTYFSEDYQKQISFVITHNAKIEYSKKHFTECEKLVDKNINSGVATEDDFILKALVTRVLYGDTKHNHLALDYLNKAEALGIEPNAYIDKQKGITYLRLGEENNALISFEKYQNQITSIYDESFDISGFEQESLKKEISWAKRMIYKSGK